MFQIPPTGVIIFREPFKVALEAQEFLLVNYGITHFDPETYLPIMKLKPNDPVIQGMWNSLRQVMKITACEPCFQKSFSLFNS
jgi:hypothetical protein